jgi:predicted nucleic acid-binding protein
VASFVDTNILLYAISTHSAEVPSTLTYVNRDRKMTYMEKTQVYLRKEELDALRQAAARSGRSVAELVREAIRQVVLKPPPSGPVAIWDGEPKRTSIEHDSVHDQP